MELKGYSVGGGGGEIVEVQGGHIIRATGRKDRHSKVFTSKGPRDRRVRLSAHTAIQFYDVQDRLGYDRPSKAVDWLIKKAKAAIDKLEIAETTSTCQEPVNTKPGSPDLVFQRENNDQTPQTQFVAANLDPEDAMKTFFPATTTTGGGGTNMDFQNYPHHDDDNIVSRTATTTPNLSQDLGLSLHPFQGSTNAVVVPETNNFTTTHFETFGRIPGWNHHDLTMTSSSSSEQQEEERSNGGFMVNHHHHQPSMMTLLNSQQQVFLGGQQQRGTLQSSLFPHSFRSWDHQTTSDHHDHHHHNQASNSVMFASSSQFGSHGMMMMQGLSFPNTTRLLHGEEATQPNSSSSPPNSHL